MWEPEGAPGAKVPNCFLELLPPGRRAILEDLGPAGGKCLYVAPEAELKKEIAQKRRRVLPVTLEGLALELGAGAARL